MASTLDPYGQEPYDDSHDDDANPPGGDETMTTSRLDTMSDETENELRALHAEAVSAGDELQVAMCEASLSHPLRDSETGCPVEASEVGGAVAYTELVAASLAAGAEGHVLTRGGRRVYAE